MKVRAITHTTVAFSALFALAGCSHVPPKAHQFESTRSYPNVSFDEGWEHVVGFFAHNSIPIKNIAKDSGVIYAETTVFPEAVADCGSTFEGIESWDPEDLSYVISGGKFNVFFRRSDPITVTVNAEFVRVYDGLTYRCESTGVLETMVLDAVGGNWLRKM